MGKLLFFHPDLAAESFALSEEESKHLTRVLRKKAGDRVQFINGEGIEAIGVILEDHAKHVHIQILERITHPNPRNYRFHLAIAPTKNIERIEWMLEKCAEIGIDEISFLSCSNSERTVLKQERFTKILISALKQSKQFHLPKINAQITFKTFMNQVKHPEPIKWLAWCETNEDQTIKHKLAALNSDQFQEILLLVGPEGDFTTEEVEMAKSNQFETVSLGKNILRTETAGLYVCSVLANHFQ